MIKKTFKYLVALLAFLIGIIALFIPLIPTSPFLIFGGALLSPKFKEKITSWIKNFKTKRNRG